MRAVVLLVAAAVLAAAPGLDVEAEVMTLPGVRRPSGPPTLYPQDVIEYKRAQCNPSGNNATTTGTIIGLPTGHVVSVSVPSPAGTPRGRVYGQVQLLDKAENVVMLLWADYIHTGGAPSSFPGLPVSQGMKARLVITWGTAGTTERITAILGVAPGRVDGLATGVFHYVPAGPSGGRGEIREVATADPAAGADPATQTVPAVTKHKIHHAYGNLVTDATVANREPRFHITGTGTRGVFPEQVAQTASQDRWHAFGLGAHPMTAAAPIHTTAPLPDQVLDAGVQYGVNAGNMQAGDNWGAVRFTVEEWATP